MCPPHLSPPGKGCKGRSPPPQLGGVGWGSWSSPSALGRGCQGRPPWPWGWGPRGTLLQGWGAARGLYLGCGAGQLAGGSPATGGMPGAPQAMGQVKFCWRNSPCIRDEGRARTAPSSVGQGRPWGGCGDPCVHPPPQAKRGGGGQGLEGARAVPSSFPLILKKPHPFPKPSEVSPWVAASLSQTGAPANAPAPLLSSAMRGVTPGPPLLRTRGLSVCTSPASVPPSVMSRFLSRHPHSPRDGRNK